MRARGLGAGVRAHLGTARLGSGNSAALARAYTRTASTPVSIYRGPSYQPLALAATSPRTLSTKPTTAPATTGALGPLEEYDRRVHLGQLNNDEHQRGIIESLQHMHDELLKYDAPPVVHPNIASLKKKKAGGGFLSSLFGGGSAAKADGAGGSIPDNLPRGLYLYGDVGSGKTMLMNLFYDTLPANVRSKTRIHFHNFMQDVHRRLHRLKMQHGSDVDATPYVAADIADQANVLCFDEFQCTDVADAMILRRYVPPPRVLPPAGPPEA